jgi:hypothetical protein
MDVVVAFLLLTLSLTLTFSILVHWLRQTARGSRSVNHPPSSMPVPELGTVIFGADADLIRMPEDLRTREEMVAWMTRDLPKVLEEKDKTMPRSKFL